MGKKITGLIFKAILITFLLFLISRAYAQEPTTEVVTSTMPKISPDILSQIERFYEISEKSLEIGYNVTLETDSAIKTTINQNNRYIVAKNFSLDTINLVFIGKGETLFDRQLKAGNYVIFRIDDKNLQFTLIQSDTEQALIELKLFEQEIPEDVDYFELFDIRVRLAEHEIYQPTDLVAITEFTNFGEGPTHVRLVYSIFDTEGKEYFTGIDQKVVETDEVVIKNFDTLKIPNGRYIIRTTIYYGKNQEATSEESFTLRSIPKYQLLKQPALFITIVLISFITVILLKKKRKGSTFNQ
jgi:hypothetical protein